MCAFVALLAANQRGTPTPDDCPALTARVWSPVVPAVVKTRVAPQWPLVAKSMSIQGVVVLDAWIDEKGNVTCTKVTRSIPILNQAALDAVRQWRFAPATLAGKPVAVVQEIMLTHRAQ